MKFVFAVALLLLSAALMAAFLLGISALDRTLSFGLDVGVVTAAVSLILAAVGPLLITRDLRRTSIAVTAVVAAAAWLPISIALAGDFHLNYSGWRSIAWLSLSVFVLLAILISWVTSLLSYSKTKATT